MVFILKILILSDANSVHTLKWVESLQRHDLNLILFSLFKPNKDYVKKYIQSNTIVESPNLKLRSKNLRQPNLRKLYYLAGLHHLNKIINAYEPDLLHAHYASSYGILALISRFKPFILSVWGSDIFDFPNKSFINKWMIKKVINSANVVCSSSKAMLDIVRSEYRRENLHLVPFGVDTDKFKPKLNINNFFLVGTVKSIEKHNGIDCLIDAANIIIHDYNEHKIRFKIVGNGSLLEKMKQKTENLQLENYVEFTGHVFFDKIIEYHQQLSLFVAMSTSESFGVAILEAAACGVPAITSDVGGLPEVNHDNKTGFIIKPNDPQSLADLIVKLYNNEKLRKDLGLNARDMVVEKYEWKNSVEKMINIYNQCL